MKKEVFYLVSIATLILFYLVSFISAESIEWTQVGPPNIAWNNCNMECTAKGLICSEAGCLEAVNSYGNHDTFTGGEKLVSGGITTGYTCENKWGNLSDNRLNYCCCIKSSVEEEHQCMAVTSGHEINIGIFGNNGQPRLVNRETCIKIISDYKKDIEDAVCFNEKNKLEDIKIKWGTEIIKSSWIIDCRNNTVTCKDWDNGKDYYNRGQIWGLCYDCPVQNAGGNNDFCVDSNILAEFYCVDSHGWRREDVKCPNGCNEGLCINISKIQNCSDGTTDGSCSIIKPKYCLNGNIVNKCSICGCDNNYICDNEQCRMPTESCDREGERECFENGYHVCRKYMDEETGKQYLAWSSEINCLQGCLEGSCKESVSRIKCDEQIKNNLCGDSQEILPLGNYQEGNEYNQYSGGIIYDDSSFSFISDYPNKVNKNEEYTFKLTITNKKASTQTLYYSEYTCKDCYYEIISLNSGLSNTPDGKNYQDNFAPSQSKTIEIHLKASQPTLVKYDTPFFVFTYRLGADEKQMNFKSLVEISQLESDSLKCNNRVFTTYLPSFSQELTGRISYNTGVCCNNTFYPSAECCNDDYCKEFEWSNGYCLDGRCISKNHQYYLNGNKKILYIYSIGQTNKCEDISIPTHISDAVSSLEKYYDTMAKRVISQEPSFVNFELKKIVNAPIDFNHQFNSEQDISDALMNECNINYSDYDIIVVPQEMGSIIGENAPHVSGKTIYLSSPVGFTELPFSLIHEIGHIFGCSDLYGDLGGRLQWRSTTYGLQRKNIDQVGGMILRKEFDKIPDKAFAVCRGELRWTDLNNNGVVDVFEGDSFLKISNNDKIIKTNPEEGCSQLGYRKVGKYCTDSLEWANQKLSEESCENNFECESNLCINNKCVSGSLWQKIMNWFSKLFGGN